MCGDVASLSRGMATRFVINEPVAKDNERLLGSTLTSVERIVPNFINVLLPSKIRLDILVLKHFPRLTYEE